MNAAVQLRVRPTDIPPDRTVGSGSDTWFGEFCKVYACLSFANAMTAACTVRLEASSPYCTDKQRFLFESVVTCVTHYIDKT